MINTRVLAAILVLAGVQVTYAQTPPVPRGFVLVNGTYQMGEHAFTDGATKQVNAEESRFSVAYKVPAATVIDVAGGVRVWRQLGFGVGVSRFTASTSATLSGTVPHPFFFSQPRSVSGDVGDLTREVLAVHLQAVGIFPIGRRVQAMLFGGPSIVQVKQGLVTDFTFTETYPYDTAVFQQATAVTASASAVGFNAGGDLAFFFSKQVGVGVTGQFSNATVGVAGASATQSLEVGGLRVGGGLRVRF